MAPAAIDEQAGRAPGMVSLGAHAAGTLHAIRIQVPERIPVARAFREDGPAGTRIGQLVARGTTRVATCSITSSSYWFQVRLRKRTTPRVGLEFDGRTSSTSTST